MFFMEEKKKIGLLTLVLAIAGIIFAFIDAIVSVSYGVVPPEQPPSADFMNLAINGPVWWRINPIIMSVIIGVGIIAYLIGSDKKLSARSRNDFFGFARVILTFVLMSFSGLGDLMAQTVVEYLSGNSPFYWVTREWWWTKFMPFPAVVSFLAGHSVPWGSDMIIASIIGIIILSVMWLQYYEKIGFTKLRKRFLLLFS
jgi:hypothetical protein